MSILHLNSVKSYPEKSRLIKCGDWMCSVMIAIEYSNKLGRKNILIYGASLAGNCTDSHIYAHTYGPWARVYICNGQIPLACVTTCAYLTEIKCICLIGVL